MVALLNQPTAERRAEPAPAARRSSRASRTPLAKVGTAFRNVHVTDLARRAIAGNALPRNLPRRPARRGDPRQRRDAGRRGQPRARRRAVGGRARTTCPALTVQRNCASRHGGDRRSRGMSRPRDGARTRSADPRRRRRVDEHHPAAASRNETLEPMARLRRRQGPVAEGRRPIATLRPRHFKPVAGLEVGLTDPTCGLIMGKTAELLAQEFGISRREQDEFALRSHQRAAAARRPGEFNDEIVPGLRPRRQGFEPVTDDVGPRANQTMEALAKLKPIFDRRDGTVTVGNSCQVTDGAVAAAGHGRGRRRAPRAWRCSATSAAYAYAGLDPARMGLGPVFAIDKLLRETGLSLNDIPLFEINEAFAAQVLACLKAMASRVVRARAPGPRRAARRDRPGSPERQRRRDRARPPGRRDRAPARADAAARDAPARRRPRRRRPVRRRRPRGGDPAGTGGELRWKPADIVDPNDTDADERRDRSGWTCPASR